MRIEIALDEINSLKKDKEKFPRRGRRHPAVVEDRGHQCLSTVNGHCRLELNIDVKIDLSMTSYQFSH